MNPVVIDVKNVSKRYIISHRANYETLRDTLSEAAKKPFRILAGRPHQTQEDFWALKNVSFQVRRGERIGIIGRNGAGKSTMLKILSQITLPTTGQITMTGRVASLLEVGTGFHPELTGRENIFLNGAILGMKQSEIRKKFDEIVAFSEIEKFLDTPVKRYSSGMYVRLAFAVAAHLDPEILIVDEVLAVGDQQFQKKCLGKMEDFAKSGRTVLFVSHNLAAINQLCDSCVLLHQGSVQAQGPTAQVVEEYLNVLAPTSSVYEQPHQPEKRMNLRRASINPDQSEASTTVNYDDDTDIRIEYEVNHPIANATVWILIQNLSGVVAFCSADYDTHPELTGQRDPGYYQTDVRLPKKMLSPGMYDIVVGVSGNTIPAVTFDRIEAIRFEVVDNGTSPKSIFHESSRSGIFQPFLDWNTIKRQ